MIPYSKYAPTEFDHKGAFLYDQGDWLVLGLIQTRDSGPLELSNFATAERLLEATTPAKCECTTDDCRCATYENHRFGHWGPGWYEILIVKPGSPAELVAREIEKRLENYPILDEDDFSARECEEAELSWKYTSLKERIELCAKGCVSIFAARHDYPPSDDNGYIKERLLGH